MKATVFYLDDHPNPERGPLVELEARTREGLDNLLFRWAHGFSSASFDHTMAHEVRVEVDGVRQRYIPYSHEGGGSFVAEETS